MSNHLEDDRQYFSLLGADESGSEILAQKVARFMAELNVPHERARVLVNPYLYQHQRGLNRA